MNVMIGPRRSGKTRQLLLWMKDAPRGTTRVCVAPNQPMAELLKAYATDMGIDYKSWQFIGPTNIDVKLAGRAGPIEIGVDQVDLMPADFDKNLFHPIMFATATQD